MSLMMNGNKVAMQSLVNSYKLVMCQCHSHTSMLLFFLSISSANVSGVCVGNLITKMILFICS